MYKEIRKLIRIFRQNTPSLIRDEFGKSYTIYGCNEAGRDRSYHVEMYDQPLGKGGKLLFHYLLIPRTYYYM